MNQFTLLPKKNLSRLAAYVTLRAQTDLPTQFGQTKLYVFQENNPITRFLRLTERAAALFGKHLPPWLNDAYTHVALVTGSPQPGCLIRIHSECLTGDVFKSAKCDCGEQLEAARLKIQDEGIGILLYMRQEGRNIGLVHKVEAYNLQSTQGCDTVDANRKLGLPDDARTYRAEAAILASLGLNFVQVLTNNPKKIEGLEKWGLKAERVPHVIEATPHSRDYLKAKREKMGHRIPQESLAACNALR
ncbi:MAG: GTP cyclohydrolase II [Bdellovibrionales bacterium]